jgi:hypothetical protein
MRIFGLVEMHLEQEFLVLIPLHIVYVLFCLVTYVAHCGGSLFIEGANSCFRRKDKTVNTIIDGVGDVYNFRPSGD